MVGQAPVAVPERGLPRMIVGRVMEGSGGSRRITEEGTIKVKSHDVGQELIGGIRNCDGRP